MKNLAILSLIFLSFGSCKKEDPKPTPSPIPPKSTTDWYIYDWYSQMDGVSTVIPTGPTGLDHKLEFRSDGTIDYYIQSYPSGKAFWGYHSSSTITFGSGGQGSVVYQIVNQSSTELQAEKYDATNGITFYLTLKK